MISFDDGDDDNDDVAGALCLLLTDIVHALKQQWDPIILI